MKIILMLFFACFIAVVQKAKAQAAGPDSAATANIAKTPSRAERMREIAARRDALRSPAPQYKGAPAKAARHDSRRFTLPTALLPKLRAGDITASSDYFKPTTATAANHALLTDSGYVKMYRYYAFNNAQRQMIHPAGTGFLIGGSVLAFTALMLVLILAVFGRSKG